MLPPELPEEMAYYFPHACVVVNGLGLQPPPSPSPAAQSSGETKPSKLPQMLEGSLSTCTVGIWTHPHILTGWKWVGSGAGPEEGEAMS